MIETAVIPGKVMVSLSKVMGDFRSALFDPTFITLSKKSMKAT
ncbi:uncharacterized protein METZ01_LOCUS175056 [marine metagenome]|uniref:Uncharacterized protein n=1 Tax=marine metagenome TaxID=408172 RepID=A0A382C8R5_9ZZZZ